MSGYLANLVSRSLQQTSGRQSVERLTPLLRPELPSLFAPAMSEVQSRPIWDPEMESGIEQTASASSRRQTPKMREEQAVAEISEEEGHVRAPQAPRIAAKPAQAAEMPSARDAAAVFAPELGSVNKRTSLKEEAKHSAASVQIKARESEVSSDSQLLMVSKKREGTAQPREESIEVKSAELDLPNRQVVAEQDTSSQTAANTPPANANIPHTPLPAASTREETYSPHHRSERSLANDLTETYRVGDYSKGEHDVPEPSEDQNAVFVAMREPRVSQLSKAAEPGGSELLRALRTMSQATRRELPSKEQVIEVSIGRIEVRAPSQPTTKPSSTEAAKGPSLKEYLRGRSGRGRA